MDPTRRYEVTSALLTVLALAHALATWPLRHALVLFVGGALVAFVLEAVGIAAGLFHHEMRPKLLGVPLAVVGAWPALVYLTYRAALLGLSPGVQAAAGAAVVATALDVLTERNAVEQGVWHYPERPISSPRVAGAPWWNYLAWLGVVFLTAMLPTLAVRLAA